MRVLYAFLANAAEVSADRKLSVLGADFDTITASSFPAMHPMMALVVKLAASPEEVGRKQSVSVQVVGPDGETVASFDSDVPAPKANDPLKEGKLTIVGQIIQAVYPAPGDYSVRINIDAEEMVRLPLRLVQATPQEAR